MTVLAIDGVTIRYGDTTVVHDASFAVGEGEFVTLLGPSGSGKTSLLRAIAGFVRPASGKVMLRGKVVNDVPPYARDIGMVFQNYALFPHMTVEGNVRFGLEMRGVAKAAMPARVQAALESVRLTGFGARYPHELSGGQQQRVAVARAIATHPSVLLLDEPMSNLDARLRAEMRFELAEVLEREKVTAVSVTHNQEEAMAMSDRIVVIDEGRIRQIGAPAEVYGRPTSEFVAKFLGDANILAGQVVRPEDITIEPASARSEAGRVHGKVVHTAFMGSFHEVRVDAGAAVVIVRTPRGARVPAVGEAVDLVYAHDALHRIQ